MQCKVNFTFITEPLSYYARIVRNILFVRNYLSSLSMIEIIPTTSINRLCPVCISTIASSIAP